MAGAGETWTARRMLQWMTEDFRQRGLASPRLDAELLVTKALGCTRLALYMDLDRPLSAAELEDLRALVARRRRREPVAYLLGNREFYGRVFEVTPAVLIPRPDTEVLVTAALATIDALGATQLLDLCTGSGALAVTLAAERSALEVHATDLSSDALLVAERNALRHGVAARVILHQGDLLNAVPSGARYGVVVCNPPYISDGDFDALAPDVRDHEPAMALRGGADGLDFYRRLIPQLCEVLAPRGAALFEVGEGQAAPVAEMLSAAGGKVRIHADLGGIDRVVEARFEA